MSFHRDGMPGWLAYADSEGMTLEGRGKWRTTRCDFHGGSDSLRVNVERGGWICMSCGAKGGDTLSHYQQRHGLEFVEAARALGAWIDDGKPAPPPRAFSARDALSCVEIELNVCMCVISDARRGLIPNDSDWQRFLSRQSRNQTGNTMADPPMAR